MTSPRERYETGEAAANAEARTLDRRVLRNSRLRVVAFLTAAAPFLLLETTRRALWPVLIAAGSVAGLVFIGFVLRHTRLKKALRRARLRETLNQEAGARLGRHWGAMPPPPLLSAPEDHPCAGDLDLVGRASLSHLVGRVTTAPGRALLRQLLLDPFAPLPADGAELLARLDVDPARPATRPNEDWARELHTRQEAVAVLAAEAELREELELLGREVPGDGTAENTRIFLEWLAEPLWLPTHGALLAAGRVLGIFTPLTLVTAVLGWTPGALPVIGALAALALFRAVAPEAHRRLSAAEAVESDLAGWAAQLALTEGLPEGKSRLLDRIRHEATEPQPGAAKAIRRLMRINDAANARRSSLVHFPLAAIFAFDVHMLDWLERWHAKHARAAERWVRALGELEVLGALAGLRYDNPDWCFPELEEEPSAAITAEALGHPLLDPAVCVRNDVEVPGPGRLLLVTGSNMAGKTTLIRAIGANQILALAGAPVAAERFRTRPVLPWCAMRVRDSLEEGVSYFLAELRRLKRVVDAARACPSLYLLDEILQGTNSAERRTAARIVLGQLLETPSFGAITTHDLTLAASPELEPRSVNVHFREEVTEVDGHRQLDFDYLLRFGPATSRNALLLLEIVGLAPEGSSAGKEEPES